MNVTMSQPSKGQNYVICNTTQISKIPKSTDGHIQQGKKCYSTIVGQLMLTVIDSLHI